MSNIYLIPGLGADQRLFENYDFPGYSVQVVDWITPQNEESLTHYAERLASAIPEHDPMLLGVSFGGMLANEIARHKPNACIILLSSVPHHGGLPRLLRWAAASGIIHWVPKRLLQQPGQIANLLFGVTTPAGKQLLKEILLNTPPAFTRWAVQAIGRWRSENTNAVKLHIHGKSDWVIQSPRHVDHLLEGGHFIVFEKSEAINQLVMQWLLSRQP